MTRSRIGRPARLDRASIARAAIDLADRRSLREVTMRALAAELDSAPAALYRHVGDRDEVVALMIDEVLREREAIRGSGVWRDDLAAFAAGMFSLHRQHSWLSLGVLPETMGPRVTGVMEEAIGLLSSHPAPAGRKYAAIAVLLELIAGHARSAAQIGIGAAQIADSAAESTDSTTESADGKAGTSSGARAGSGADEDYASAVMMAAVGGILDAQDL